MKAGRKAKMRRAVAELADIEAAPECYHDMSNPRALGRARYVAGDPISLNPYVPPFPGEDGDWWEMRAGWREAAMADGGNTDIDDEAAYSAALDALEEHLLTTFRQAEVDRLRRMRSKK